MRNLALVLSLASLLACAAASSDEPVGELGESCTKRADCDTSLRCIEGTCVDPEAAKKTAPPPPDCAENEGRGESWAGGED